MSLSKEQVETILYKEFGIDLKKLIFAEKWNLAWRLQSEANEIDKVPLQLEDYNGDKSDKSHQRNTSDKDSVLSRTSRKLVNSSPPPKKLETIIEGGYVGKKNSGNDQVDQVDQVGKKSEFRQVPQKFTSISNSYYIGRESTDRDTNKVFESWKMIKHNFQSAHEATQSQRMHFGSGPERELEYAQASISPSETRKCTLALDLNSSSSRRQNTCQFVTSKAGASWDIECDEGSLRTEIEALLTDLNRFPSLLSYFRSSLDKFNIRIESISSSNLSSSGFRFSSKEFEDSAGFCALDENENCIAFVTCADGYFDSLVSLNLIEDDAIDCSYLPYFGSNFSEEDKFSFASKSGLLLFVYSVKTCPKWVPAALSLIILEANAENAYVSVTAVCEAHNAEQLSQDLGLLRTSWNEDFCEDVFKRKCAPPVEVENTLRLKGTECQLFKIFPSPSQVLGSCLLLYSQMKQENHVRKLEEENDIRHRQRTRDAEKEAFLNLNKEEAIEKEKARKRELVLVEKIDKVVDEEDNDKRTESYSRGKVGLKKNRGKFELNDNMSTLTAVENSAEQFDKKVDVWKGSLESLRKQLVENN